ncbi:archaeal proteasome endopeptidase complex subunit alpha [Halorubellus sp. JP-L1]|uniref:archaeal proteasome endopeptidase complex subunit alpha n=1 Tax=Halorubellus sp. JP-L1 TaxID=2715753 RepID=UPI00140E9237|nr:archaeal proteasome endopeptidase complex subunit alpha [Halorubellus sp. JP-L1]NHN40316.1 archaeal proteasome endopeptidase complex subunit alpha [Halorubellus sp. JP-L1]
MQDTNQMAYDRGITLFSPDGRLYQVEYAREAVKRGTSTVGVRTDAGVVLAADKRSRSPLMEGESVEKIHELDAHLAVATAGHVADGRRLVDYARRDAQVNRLRYGERIGVSTATRHLSDFVQGYTQIGGARPFGVAMLVAGVDRDGRPRLFETDPSGTAYEWQAVAVGANRAEVQSFLEEHYDADGDLDDAISLAIRAIGAPSEDALDAEGVAVVTVDAESERVVRLAESEVAEYLADLDDEPSDETDEGSNGTDEGADGTDEASNEAETESVGDDDSPDSGTE